MQTFQEWLDDYSQNLDLKDYLSLLKEIQDEVKRRTEYLDLLYSEVIKRERMNEDETGSQAQGMTRND